MAPGNRRGIHELQCPKGSNGSEELNLTQIKKVKSRTVPSHGWTPLFFAETTPYPVLFCPCLSSSLLPQFSSSLLFPFLLSLPPPLFPYLRKLTSDAPYYSLILRSRDFSHECPAAPAVGAGALSRDPQCSRGEILPFSDALRYASLCDGTFLCSGRELFTDNCTCHQPLKSADSRF